ncbi:transglycosylase SLT domain-containing protein [Rhodoferax aquaticus]|uniref:LysM peptidoglycan-binding domain-containing protein n=1 Tax=Rhodoferax aquaticus TaxID=2527691 RepID=A0A515EQF3_9BURK|nr:transglycosylase SLT domain-containing protein [Rhodoferax aquaticus]QDL54869.1 LysM peptidoglycan-binding domain-containing protein [Rhodoferax aquaticus]
MNFLNTTVLCIGLLLAGCASSGVNDSRGLSGSTSTVTRLGTGADALVLSPTRELKTPPITQASGPALGPNDTVPLAPMSLQSPSTRTVASLSAPADLWERIRRGYAMPDLDNDLVRDREQWYANKPDYIYRMTDRSKKYLFHIVEELEMRNMPTELALLPFVESAFNPQAVSSAKAAGMWQFMPATGKSFELKQNSFRDDRRDVLASTRAALDYLQKLYGLFGDWHLALAAYNWGQGSVGKAIAKNQKAGLNTGYTDLNMPMETRFYVPKLQAIKNIVTAPDSFNSKLPHISNNPYFQSVTIRNDIDVTLAAKLAEVPLDDFKALNPSVNKPVIMAAGTPQILLPWDNAAIFQSNLEGFSGGRLASWTVWLAPTTMRTADVAKKVGMSEADLRNVNNIPPKMVIRAGSSLLVPRSARMDKDVTEHLADNGQLSVAPEVVLKRTLVRAGKNESVATIARKFNVSTANVAQWNKVGSNANFKQGQQVVLFVPANSGKKGKATATGRAATPTQVSAAKPQPKRTQSKS